MLRHPTRRTILRTGVAAAAAIAARPSWSVSSAAPGPRPKGDRQLAIAVTEPENGDVDAAFARAVDAGMDRTTLTLLWSDVEREPEVYDTFYPEIADRFYPAVDMPVDLVLGPIATNRLMVPTDLADRPFNDPVVIARFDAWVASLLSQMTNVAIPTVLIGLEIDGLLGTDLATWRSYATFAERTAASFRRLCPDTLIGVEGMFDGRMGLAADLFPLVDDVADFIAVSYYWMDGFQVLAPDEVPRQLERLVRRYPDKPIHLVECGYASSPFNGSSPERQAEWLRAIFRAWDEYATEIPVVTLVWEHDISPETVASYEDFYGLKDEAFAAYLGSIGLRTFEGAGRDKPAWSALVEETTARGW